MQSFTLIFLSTVIVVASLRCWLLQRQRSAVSGTAGHPAAAIVEQIPPPQRRSAAAYARELIQLRQADGLIDTLLLLAWTVGGGIAAFDAFWRSFGWHPVVTGTLVIASVIAISAIVDLPLRVWRIFGIEQRHGFNRTTAGLFIADQLRLALLGAGLGLPLLGIVLWLMEASGALWWLWVWLLWCAVNIAMLVLGPRFIAPLFNDYQPLRDRALRERLEQLLERCGFRHDGLYVVDGSRRSGHANAYFTGFGRQRRIVLFDTLLEQLDSRQLEAVLAHELGHFRLRHITIRLLISVTVSLVALVLLAWLLEQNWFYSGLGVTQPSTYSGLLLFLLTAPLIAFFGKPLSAALARRHEFAADAFAAEHARAEDLISALLVLYRENASAVQPDWLYSWFHDSHPPAQPRIDRLRALAARQDLANTSIASI